MTRSPAERPRGRHARPPSRLEIRRNRMIALVLRSRRRRLAAAGAGVAVAAALASVAALTLTGGSGSDPRAAVAASTSAGSPEPQQTVEAAGDTDEIPDAVPYLKTRDTDGKVVKHVTDVRRSGRFVRVYTDLSEGDENSGPALDLCKWTTRFLRDGGDVEPRVFVHGKSKGNGSIVLANKQSDEDDCEVGETR